MRKEKGFTSIYAKEIKILNFGREEGIREGVGSRGSGTKERIKPECGISNTNNVIIHDW